MAMTGIRAPAKGQPTTNNEMIINSHNYEEYFILYMDNELSSDERRMVEAFMQEHPDLKEELELLEQFKLIPDKAISFPHKEDLLKENGEALITLNNYEEWLVLYIDNELTHTKRIKVESFAAAHPHVAAELALLQRTKLRPEAVVFTDKQFLYRREEKVRPIGVIRWRAAAAVLLFGLGVTIALVINNNGKDGSTASGTNTPVPSVNNPELVKGTTPIQNGEAKKEALPVVKEGILSPEKNSTTPSTYKQVVANINKMPQKENRKELKQISPIDNENKQAPVMVDINNKPNNNLPKPDQNPYVQQKEYDAITVIAKSDIPPVKTDNNISATNEIVTTQATQPSDYILSSNGGKKNKNRGIFRKIARTFEKRTNIDPTEDGDKLLVAGFAIKMK
jgi:hypothetical protein